MNIRILSIALLAALGAGYELIDVAAARARGIAVSYGRGTNTSRLSASANWSGASRSHQISSPAR